MAGPDSGYEMSLGAEDERQGHMLYATLLAPVLAIPGIVLMDRLERWVTTGTRGS